MAGVAPFGRGGREPYREEAVLRFTTLAMVHHTSDGCTGRAKAETYN